jgi:copper transport protein
MRRGTALAPLLLLFMIAMTAPEGAAAHSGLIRSQPLADATLGASPTDVKLTFSERPQASLTEISVRDKSGKPLQIGPPQPVPGEPLALSVQVEKLPRGVYTVGWRALSAVDGHASSGAFAFGVNASPRGAKVAAPAIETSVSALEVVARWLLLTGLTLLLGATVAGAAGFGGERGTDVRLAAAAWVGSAAGLALLTVAQVDATDSSLSNLVRTPVGEALIWRALALGAAGAALLVARRRPKVRRYALAAAAAACLAAIVVHVDAGHAAAGTWARGLTVVSQSAHFAAAGIWFGGLAALLLGVRGAPSEPKAAAVRRFSAVALGAVVLVAATGVLRAVDELSSWSDLTDTGYGRAVLAKAALLGLIVALARGNRRRSVPVAGKDLRPLRRTSRIELVLAVAAVATAALLGSLAPPVAGQPSALRDIRASGADFATTLRVELRAPSDEPGPNRFSVRVEDYDTHEPVTQASVRLRFTPIDDPGVASTTLALKAGASAGSFLGTGANLEFDGRWRVTVLVERQTDAAEIPLSVDVRGPEHFTNVLAIPGEAPIHTLEIQGTADIRLTPQPERAGPSNVKVTIFDIFGSDLPIRQIVLTTQAGGGPVRQWPLKRTGKSRFVAPLVLERGPVTVTVVARTVVDQRLRGVFDLRIPG